MVESKMNSLANKIARILGYWVLFMFSLYTGLAEMAYGGVDGKSGSIKEAIVADIIKAVESKDFRHLYRYFPDEDRLAWGSCGPTDMSPELFSVKEVLNILSNQAQKVTIHVNETPSETFMLSVETSGWPDYEQYVYFNFTKKTDSWVWSSVCHYYQRTWDFKEKPTE